MPFIVGFAGHSGVGKNTCAELFEVVCPLRVQSVSFATELKNVSHMLYSHLGLETAEYYEKNRDLRHIRLPEIDKTPVQIWAEVGHKMRDVYRNTWVDKAMQTISQMNCDVACITDVRYPSEIEAIYASGGVVVKVHNKRTKPLNTEGDHALDKWTGLYSYEITNHSTKTHLENQIHSLWTSVRRLAKTRTSDKVLA